jgi:hypothetical protein
MLLRSIIAEATAEELHRRQQYCMCRSRRLTAQNQEAEDALRLRLLGGRRRIVRNLLPMPEPVLQDLNTVQLDVHEWSLECRGVDPDRCSAGSLLQPRTSGLPRKGRSSDRCARSGRP